MKWISIQTFGSDSESGVRSTVTNNSESTLLNEYYLSSSADPGNVICSVLLNETNYERWSKLMRNSLKAKNKLGFIDGIVTKPTSNSDKIKLWDIVNSMLVAWILNTIEPKLRGSISCPDAAYELWESLRVLFSVGNEARIYELEAAVSACKQDGQSVQDYYRRLKMMWDDLDVYDSISYCCCGSSNCAKNKEILAKRQRARKSQFLMGLDSARFGTTRSNILCMQPSPSLDSAYSMVVQEERHQTVTRTVEARSEGVGFSVQVGSSSGRGRSIFQCSHCGRSGHEVSRCYQLHGFPDSSNDTSSGRGRGGLSNGVGGRGRGNLSSSGRGRATSSGYDRANNMQMQTSVPSGQRHTITESDREGLPLNDAQWGQLLKLLSKDKQPSSDRLSGPSYEDADWSG